MDIHKIQAAKIFNTSIDYVSQEMRIVGKFANYGNLYGMSNNRRQYPKEYLENMLNKLKDIIVVVKRGKAVRFSYPEYPNYIIEAIKFVENLGESNIKKIWVESWGDAGKKHPKLTLQDLYNMKMVEELSK